MKNNIDIQNQLRQLGLYNGAIDGIIGNLTKAAIRGFQRLHPPLKVTGRTGTETRNLLFPPNIAERCHTGLQSPFPKYHNIEEYYGDIGDNSKLATLTIPYPMKLAWNQQITIKKFTCHRKLIDVFGCLFEQVLRHYGIVAIRHLRLDMFGGCHQIRKMKGGTLYSTHSWGSAIDIDPARNQLRWNSDKAQLAKKEYLDFWNIVEDMQLVSLGKRKNYDWMHIQAIET